jgi:NDP-sugar pyrophosphorylase family protein
MHALVLAGGRGTRLTPLTPALPKPFAPVANRPVLAWVMDHLDTADLDCIGVIVPAEQTGLYRQGFGTRTAAGTPIRWLPEPEPLGTGGALRAQSGFFGDDPVLVVPADLLCPVDLRALITHHAQTGRPGATVAVTTCDLDTWDGDIALVDSGRVTGYLFKPQRPVTSDLGSTGTWLVEPALVQRIPPGFCDFSSMILPGLVTGDLGLGIFDTGPVYLRDVGTAGGLLRANIEAVTSHLDLDLPSRVTPSVDREAVIEDGAVLTGPVLVGAHARVRSGAQIHGAAIIGTNALIETDALVGGALVLPGATVQARQRLIDSIGGDPVDALRALLAHPVQQARA